MASRCYTFSQLIEVICKEAAIKKYQFTVPLQLVRPFASLGNLYGIITNKPAWFSQFTVYNLARNNNYYTEKAEKELGFQCRSLNKTIADTTSWLKQERKLNLYPKKLTHPDKA